MKAVKTKRWRRSRDFTKEAVLRAIDQWPDDVDGSNAFWFPPVEEARDKAANLDVFVREHKDLSLQYG